MKLKGHLIYAILFLYLTLFSVESLGQTLTAENAKAKFENANSKNFNTPFEPTKHPEAQWYPAAKTPF